MTRRTAKTKTRNPRLTWVLIWRDRCTNHLGDACDWMLQVVRNATRDDAIRAAHDVGREVRIKVWTEHGTELMYRVNRGATFRRWMDGLKAGWSRMSWDG